MAIKYAHTNIVSKDWKKLADFYIKVFECKPASKESHLTGDWVDKGTGVKNADLTGIHLLLPGFGDKGPTLEIFQYTEILEKPESLIANREGFGHIAFQADDVANTLEKMISLGGKKIGEIATKEFNSGILTFTYAADPEGNIIELTKWESK